MFYKLIITVLLLSVNNVNAAFPEMPFCPFGGAPGWLNRLSNHYNQPPNYPMPRYQTPYYNTYAYPGSSVPNYKLFPNNQQQQFDVRTSR